MGWIRKHLAKLKIVGELLVLLNKERAGTGERRKPKKHTGTYPYGHFL